MELPSPPPPEPSAPPPMSTGGPGCVADRKYDRYLKLKKWAAKDMQLAKGRLGSNNAAEAAAAQQQREDGGDPGYMCYQHRDVAQDVRFGRSTCRPPYTAKRCPIRQPTFPTPAGSCLCCPMAGHRCPTCWGCLLPLSRRRAFAGKLYERETGGTANVFFAAETLDGSRRDVIFKLRDGEVAEEERESTRLVNGIGQQCGLVRPSVALEWVAELQLMRPLPVNASLGASGHAASGHAASGHAATGANAAGANAAAATRVARAELASMRRPAVAAEVAAGVSIDMLLRSHTFGPNKQERQGARARRMIQRLRQLDSRSVIRAAIFDLLFASGDRHLEHVLMREGGAVSLIDNAHTILTPRQNTRHTANSLFLPGTNFHMRNKVGFPFLHCCSIKSTCPQPKPALCPGTHTLYWPALPLDYRCHAPRGRIGHSLPLATRTCLAELVQAGATNVSSRLRIKSSSTRLHRLLRRARMLLERGFEVCAAASSSLHISRRACRMPQGRMHACPGMSPGMTCRAVLS